MKEKIYVVMHASITKGANSKKNGTVDILYASKDIEKAKAYKNSLPPYEVTAIYPINLDCSLESEANKPALSINWTDLQ